MPPGGTCGKPLAWIRALQGTHTCGVCLEELPGTQFVRPSPGCSHAFCGGCLRGLCGVHVAEGTLDALRCPLPDCRAPFGRQARPAEPLLSPSMLHIICRFAVPVY